LKPTIDRRFSFSVSGDKVAAIVDSANIENWRRLLGAGASIANTRVSRH
jgi:hypothetical protein